MLFHLIDTKYEMDKPSSVIIWRHNNLHPQFLQLLDMRVVPKVSGLIYK